MRLPGFIRRAAGAAIGGIRLRIRGGPNRGLHWSLASSGRGVIAGRFEARRVESFTRLLRAGDVVWDIGAHKGYMTLAAARAVGPAGRVYALEPGAPNLEYLRCHVAWSGSDNIEILPVAVSDRNDTARFGGRGSSITFRLGQGDEVVDVRTMDTLLRDGCRGPDVVKIDVEGSEGDVLRGGGEAITDDCVLLIAIHSRAQYDTCRSILEARGFRIHLSGAMQRMMQQLPNGWSPDPDLLAIGPGRDVDSSIIEYFTTA